ncbi:hypothetical protein FS749_014733 [Ceratobasidium sp. UAMH 11750]|nr:hypothetical protein FS749_014733 [Ceratobasidium sp. UAMH 11750]
MPAPVPSTLPSKPALPDKSDIAKRIEEAKRRVAEGVAKKAAQENPYISAAPSKKKGAAAPVEPVQQGSGLKMAAHPLLLDTAPAPAPQSKKDRYKPMLPKFASIKANVRNQPSPSPAPHTPTPTLERPGSVSANPYASGAGAGGAGGGGDGSFEGFTPVVKDRIGRSFRFNQKGKYVAMGNQIRQEAQLEELKQRIAESAKKAGLDSEFETLERNIRREAPPAAEWWDASLLPNKTYNDLGPLVDSNPNLTNTHIRSHDSPITMYVQHPIPVPAPWEKNEAALKALKLTSKEAKKLRRRRRMADLQEKQDRVRMGLLPPDPPKVRLANLMRVLTTDAVQDPTKVEARVRREDEQQDGETGPVSLEDNRCDLVFEGPLRERTFQSFKPKRCPTDSMAKEALGAKASSYWDTAKTFVEDVYS